jgi:hypothetical protein
MTYVMSTLDDVVGRTFMAFNGNVLLPGIIVHSTDLWALHPPIGPSLNLFTCAGEAGLGQVRDLTPAAITAMFRNPAPGWRAIGDPDGGRMTIRDGQGRFDVHELTIVDPPEGWWDTTDIAARLLLLVADAALPTMSDRDSGPVMADLAANGRLRGAGVAFGAADVAAPPLPR